jgi:hypothetical protein
VFWNYLFTKLISSPDLQSFPSKCVFDPLSQPKVPHKSSNFQCVRSIEKFNLAGNHVQGYHLMLGSCFDFVITSGFRFLKSSKSKNLSTRFLKLKTIRIKMRILFLQFLKVIHTAAFYMLCSLDDLKHSITSY